jgi:hypothetical protein
MRFQSFNVHEFTSYRFTSLRVCGYGCFLSVVSVAEGMNKMIDEVSTDNK